MDRPALFVESSRLADDSAGHVSRIAIVIEGDPDLRGTLTEYLLSQQHRVLSLATTPDPEDVRRLRPDLLVIDLLCGGESLPLDLLRQVRETLHGSAIVAITADSHNLDTVPDEITVLIKPFDLDRFDAAAGLSPA